jgi:tetratricopeptide (TPR) repeat protein
MKKQGRTSEARADLEESLRIFEATGNKVNEARALSELGSIERLAGRIDQAMFLLQRAARMKGVQEPASAAVSYRELALCHAALGDSAKMRSNFKKAADLLESSGDHYELAITYRSWGDALREEKDFEEACDAYRSAAVALEAA